MALRLFCRWTSRRTICLFLLLCTVHLTGALPPATGQNGRAGTIEPAPDYEAALTRLLQQVVTEEGRVRYDLLQNSLRPDFRRVLKAVEDFDATTLRTHEQKLAFWMNAYNVQMLQNIIETPQVQHIIDDGFADAFFDTPFRTARTRITLNEIENVILRMEDGQAELMSFRVDRLDPRIHVGLNCAAVSCPRLRNRAFTADNVDTELDAAMRDFAGSPAHLRVEGSRVILSSLLDWYGSDFDEAGLPAGEFLLRYMPETRPDYDALKQALGGRRADAIKARPNVRFDYAWEVNRAQ
ncbi:MAG: DUF547 domain-containing protein [Rhodothermales bacterium]